MKNEQKTLNDWFKSNRRPEKFFNFLLIKNLLNDKLYYHWVADRIYDEYFQHENKNIQIFSKEIVKEISKNKNTWLHITGNDNYDVYVKFAYKHKIHNRQGNVVEIKDFIYDVCKEYYWLSLNELNTLKFNVITSDQTLKELFSVSKTITSSYDQRFFNKWEESIKLIK